MSVFFDADDGVAELRQRGNVAYKRGDMEEAIEMYSQVLALAPTGVEAGLALGNRSACYLSLKRWREAAEDAKAALLHTPESEKYHYRLVTALRELSKSKSGSVEVEAEAARALAEALQRLPSSAVLRKLQQSTDVSMKANSSNARNGSGDSGGSGGTVTWGNLGRNMPMFCEPCEPTSELASNASAGISGGGSRSAAVILETRTEAAYSESEYQMLLLARDLVKRLQRGDGAAMQGQGHILSGLFARLCSKSGFAEVMFPGASNEERAALPKNLRELLLWPELVLDLTAVAQAAAKVLAGAKARGEALGDVMDRDTQNMLSPQVAQEALARALETAVRQRAKNVSRVAHLQLPIASITAPQAELDQLDEDIYASLHENGLAVQHEFLGPDWAALVGRDLQRFSAAEHMSDLAEGEVLAQRPTAGRVAVRLAWLDRAYEHYPALNEAMSQLHALPYQLNKAAALQGKSPRLQQPASKVLLLHYRPLSCQPRRVDCGSGSADSGVRVTCSYHLVPTQSLHASELRYNAANMLSPSFSTAGAAQVEDDLLVLHNSRNVSTERSPAAVEYFVLCFYAHGSDAAD
jgi:hypothetical protein